MVTLLCRTVHSRHATTEPPKQKSKALVLDVQSHWISYVFSLVCGSAEWALDAYVVHLNRNSPIRW